jgi:hypothetical protein
MDMKITPPVYTFADEKGTVQVHPDKEAVAKEIAGDGDTFLSDQKIKDYLLQKHILEDPTKKAVNEERVVEDFKLNLSQKVLPQRSLYRSYDEAIAEMKDLESKYPNLCKTVVLGKTAEGRDIMALKISKDVNSDTSKKPGVLITGCHHAREWSAMEAPLSIPRELLEHYATDETVKKRVDNAEIWVVPIVNPDGYEYSRNEDSMWRKNRNPVHASDIPAQIAGQMQPDANGVVAVGVDDNRNYYDGNPEHLEYYRPEGDTAESMDDDYGGATSDDPQNETYRGPKGGSEKEIQAMLGLWMERQNIKAIVNHHAYGKDVMYPWSVKEDHVSNVKTLQEVAKKMCAAITDDHYTVQQSCGMYPSSGDPDDFATLNGKMSFTIEVGDQFATKDPKELSKIRKDVYNANMALVDWVVGHKERLMENVLVAEKQGPGDEGTYLMSGK